MFDLTEDELARRLYEASCSVNGLAPGSWSDLVASGHPMVRGWRAAAREAARLLSKVGGRP